MSGLPLQIVSIDADGNGDSFILHNDNLNQIIKKVSDRNPLIPVSIVSVVGAFRTGKSFLLNLFLRYLRNGNPEDLLSETWMMAEGEEISEGNMNEAAATPSPAPAGEGEEQAPVSEPGVLRRDSSFRWRGGKERETTGIWMWSEPFFRKSSAGTGEVAILLMDTQDMFDHETSMTLTAQIFGLSTFVSSYQIYNVDKQIQEDNLQHLALFSEYGRMASEKQKPAIVEADAESKASEAAKEGENADAPAAVEGAVAVTEAQPEGEAAGDQPFQRLLFLIRDWQHFEETVEDINESNQAELDKLMEELQSERTYYINKVVYSDKSLKDLKSTRDAITRCFEKIECFQLPHPGKHVTNKKYSGRVDQIDRFFRFMVNHLCRKVFDAELVSKTFHGRELRGLDVIPYFEAFVTLFTNGSKGFPQPQTIYDATAEANNRTSMLEALYAYKSSMTTLIGDSRNPKPYVQPDDFQIAHIGALKASVTIFDEQANMGSSDLIKKYREDLLKEVDEERARFFEVNTLKNPYRDLERFMIPIAVGAVSWLVTLLFDFVCTSDHCEAVEDTFERLYKFVFFGILVLAYRNPFKDASMYTMPLVVAVGAWFVSAVVNTACSTESCKKLTGAFSSIYLFVFFSAGVLAFRSFGGTNLLSLSTIDKITSAAQKLSTVAATAAAASQATKSD